MKRPDVTIANLRSQLSPARPQVWVLAAASVALIVHVVILMALRRGFDWSDESWSYSLIANSRITEGEAWGYQHLLHAPFEWLGESVLAFRIVRFVSYGALTLAGTAVLARISALLGFRLRRWEWWLVLVVAQIGTFLAWSFPPRYFAYNEVSALLAQTGAIAIAALVAHASGRSLIYGSTLRATVWAGTGLLTVFLTITKFTSGAVFGVVLLASLILGDGVFGWGKRFLSVAGGAALAVVWLVVSGFPIRPFAASIRSLVFAGGAGAGNGHSPRALLMTYQQSFADGVQGGLVPVMLFAIVLGLLFAASGRATKAADLMRAGALTVAVLLVLAITTLPRIDSFPSLGRFILLMGAMATVAVVLSLSQGPREANKSPMGIRMWVGVAALAFAPFISAVGTNMYITGQLLYASTVWCTLFGIALVFAARHLEHAGSAFATVPVALLALFVAISATQVAGETVNHPYRSTPYLDQSHAVDAPYLEGLLVTQEEADWAVWLVSESEMLDAKDTPTLAIASPGALLIFNNSNYANPWLDDFWPASYSTINVACDRALPDSLLVLQPATAGEETANFELFHAALATGCSIDFPADFDLVGKHESPHAQYTMEIWRLRE